jgi:hypothetical protein
MLILLAWTPVPKMSHQEGALMHYSAEAPKDRQQEAFPLSTIECKNNLV